MNELKGKRIVITGGAGFIGSNLARALSAHDNQVIVIDDLSSGKYHNIKDLVETKKIEFIQGCVTDYTLLQKVLSDIDVVFHLAAIASVPQSIRDPLTTNEVNVTGTLNVLQASKENAINKIVFSSSCAVYGNPSEENLPLKESMPVHPISPYATSKLIGEQYCSLYSSLYDLQTACLRYFNVYGPYQNPFSDYAAVIPKFMHNLLRDRPLVIYGTGEQTRDFIFVSDVVNANILAATHNVSGVFNIGSGEQVSIANLAHLIMKTGNAQTKLAYTDKQREDILSSQADISLVQEKLHFKPRVNLSKGLAETMAWLQQSRVTK